MSDGRQFRLPDKLFEKKDKKEKAITSNQSYFYAKKSENRKDRRLLDKVRVAEAIAKAGKSIGLFEDEHGLHKVLEWMIKQPQVMPFLVHIL